MDGCNTVSDIPATTPAHRKVTAVIVGAGMYWFYIRAHQDVFQKSVVTRGEHSEHQLLVLEF